MNLKKLSWLIPAAAGLTVLYPWIAQIRMTRAGCYSYDLLDNLGRPSARQLLPKHQQIYIGQLIPMSPDENQGIYVKDFKEDEWILYNAENRHGSKLCA